MAMQGEERRAGMKNLVARGLMTNDALENFYPDERAPSAFQRKAEDFMDASPDLQEAMKTVSNLTTPKTSIKVDTGKGTEAYEPDYLTKQQKEERGLDPDTEYLFDRSSGVPTPAINRNESQSRAYSNFSSMNNSNMELNNFYDRYPDFDPTGVRDSILLEIQSGEGWASRIASKLTSPEAKEYFAIMMPWTASYVQQKSGSDVKDSEIARTIMSFWPGPGDTPQSRSLKGRARQTAMEAVGTISQVSAKDRKQMNEQLERSQAYFENLLSNPDAAPPTSPMETIKQNIPTIDIGLGAMRIP